MRARVYSILDKSNRKDPLGLVFDIVLYSVIGMILIISWLNTLTVFQNQTGFSCLYRVIIIASTTFFTIEYLLRVWSCTAGDKFNKAVWGRVRFIFSPLAMVDALAIASVLFLGVNANLLFLRVIRLFRVSEYMGEDGIYSPFQILKRSVVNKKEELIITVFAAGTMIILSAYIIFYVEKNAQPNQLASLTPSVAWAFGVLTGTASTPFTPITDVGQILYFVMRIMGVVIVGLPVGIITGGFVQEIAEAKAVGSAQKRAAVIRHVFQKEDKVSTRQLIDSLGLVAHRRFLDLDVAMARLQFSSDDIFQAAANDRGLRIRACRQSVDSMYEDNLLIEQFEANASFGCFIKKPGRFHVVCTQSSSDAGIGHFSKTLATAIEASYYSNEYFSSGELLPERQVNFAVNQLYGQHDAPSLPSAFSEWKAVLEDHISRGDFVVYVGTASAQKEAVIHILCGGEKGDEINEVKVPTVDDLNSAVSFFNGLSAELNSFGLKVNSHQDYGNTNIDHISQFVRTRLNANVLSVFISVDLLQFQEATIYYKCIRALADQLKATLFLSPEKS